MSTPCLCYFNCPLCVGGINYFCPLCNVTLYTERHLAPLNLHPHKPNIGHLIYILSSDIFFKNSIILIFLWNVFDYSVLILEFGTWRRIYLISPLGSSSVKAKPRVINTSLFDLGVKSLHPSRLNMVCCCSGAPVDFQTMYHSCQPDQQSQFSACSIFVHMGNTWFFFIESHFIDLSLISNSENVHVLLPSLTQ